MGGYPITSDHEHKYYIFKTLTTYEPQTEIINTSKQFYTMTEYAIIACNCGDVVKTKVKNYQGEEDEH